MSRPRSNKDLATMKKTVLPALAWAALAVSAATPAMAQEAGTVAVKLGYNQIEKITQ